MQLHKIFIHFRQGPNNKVPPINQKKGNRNIIAFKTIPYTANRLFVFIETNAKIIPIGESNNGKNTGIPCHGIEITPIKKLIIKIAEIIGIMIEKIAAAFLTFIMKASLRSFKIIVLSISLSFKIRFRKLRKMLFPKVEQINLYTFTVL